MVEPRSGAPLRCAAHWRTVCQTKEDGSGDLVGAHVVYGSDRCSGDVVARGEWPSMCINKESFGMMLSPGESFPPGVEPFGMNMCESAGAGVLSKMFSEPDCTGQALYRMSTGGDECQTCIGDSDSDSDSGILVRAQCIPVLRMLRVSAST